MPVLFLHSLGLGLSLTSAKLQQTAKLLATAFPSDQYADRLMVGRQEQLGPGMVYRPGLGGGGDAVDGSLTYGEFDLELFATLVERAFGSRGPAGRTFVDVGSGCGRLVLAAAALWPELACVAGVERQEELHRMAEAASAAINLPVRPLRRFVCADAADALAPAGELAAGASDVLFAYSSSFAGYGDRLTDFSSTCGTVLPVGARVVTTDKRLADGEFWRFELLDAIDGANRETAGSVGYVHEVTRSLRRA